MQTLIATHETRLDSLVDRLVNTNNAIDQLLGQHRDAVANAGDTFAIQTRYQQVTQQRMELIARLSSLQ